MKVGRGVLSGLLALALLACGKTSPSPASKATAPSAPPLTSVAKPAPPEVPAWPEAIVELYGWREEPVAAPQGGYLVKQLYKEKEFVKAGVALFLLDTRTLPADAKSSQIQVNAPIAGVPAPPVHGPGDWIEAKETLTTIASVDPIRAEYVLSADFCAKNRVYLKAFDATQLTGRPANVTLVMPDGAAYPQKGTIIGFCYQGYGGRCAVGVEFPNHGHVLQPGEFVRVRGVP